MAAGVDREVLGDWNNLKGTAYHFLYALWLLLRGEATTVAFYQGNDLLARPVAPPILDSGVPSSETVTLAARSETQDVWIQLKSSTSKWTCTDLLSENLLANFVCNALASQRAGRAWQVRLVTQGPVDSNDVREFASAPSGHSRQNARLIEICETVRNRFLAQKQPLDGGEDASLYDLALSILSNLADTEPLTFATLKAEIEVELAYAYPSRDAVARIANTLMGALLSDSAGGPGSSRSYDLAWLNAAAGRPIKQRGLMDTSPSAACDEAVRRALPRGFAAEQNVRRAALFDALNQFLGSPSTVFVLVGSSGTGKSWAMADWATQRLRGCARLLIPRGGLDDERELDGLIAQQLRGFTAADWSNEMFTRALQAHAIAPGREPLVIIIDDVIPSGDIPVERRDLARLVRACKELGAKLVITCVRSIWALYRLGADISSEDIFLTEASIAGVDPPEADTAEKSAESSGTQTSSRSETSRTEVTHRLAHDAVSFVLDDFTSEELKQKLGRLLPPERAERAALHLRSPAFLALRNPYLVDRYLERFGDSLGLPSTAPIPADTDLLLDGRVQDALLSVSDDLLCDASEVSAGLDAVVERLWATRPAGLRRAEVVDLLAVHLRDSASKALPEFQRATMLSFGSQIRLAEPLVAERLFAKRLGPRVIADMSSVITELRAEDDSQVVVALIRDVIGDPVPLADALLQSDSRWVGAVARGLAQSTAEDYRILALLTVMAQSGKRGRYNGEALDALGQLAVRSRRARQWLQEMYLGSCDTDRHLGSYMASAALEYDPVLVEALMRLRLSGAAARPTSDRAGRERCLRGALIPLLRVNHEAAGKVGERILLRCESLLYDAQKKPLADFVRAFDEARGRTALFRGVQSVEHLLDELRSTDLIARYRAACALRAVAFERPDAVKDGLLEALRVEQNDAVLNRLLWAAYRLVVESPDDFMEALSQSRAVSWRSPSGATGLGLASLGHLAHKLPQEVFALLPRDLSGHPPGNRALLSEMLSYAWWQCADILPTARQQLEALSIPDLDGVPSDAHVFALRGAMIAQLGLRCLGVVSAQNLVGQQSPYPSWDLQFHYVVIGDFLRKHLTVLRAQAGIEQVEETLARCLEAAEAHQADVLNKALFSAQHHAASICLDSLIAFADQSDHLASFLKRLPRGWQAIHAARRLVEEGLDDADIAGFARDLCAEYDKGGSVQALYERNAYFACLSARQPTAEEAFVHYRKMIGRCHISDGGLTVGLATTTSRFPEHTVELLEQALQTQGDAIFLYDWAEQCCSWSSLLIARVYRRMFDQCPISEYQAKELCQQMLVGLREQADSPTKDDHLGMYETIAHWLDGERPASRPPERASGVLQQSHELARSLLRQALQRESSDRSWITDALADRRGWWESSEYRLTDASISWGSGLYLIYSFPAVRLACIALSSSSGRSDLVAQMMDDRSRAAEFIHQHDWVLDPNANPQDEYLEDILAKFEEQVKATPNDERLWARYGHLLIRLGRLEDAEKSLVRALKSFACDKDTSADTLYNLACVYAQLA